MNFANGQFFNCSILTKLTKFNSREKYFPSGEKARTKLRVTNDNNKTKKQQ